MSKGVRFAEITFGSPAKLCVSLTDYFLDKNQEQPLSRALVFTDFCIYSSQSAIINKLLCPFHLNLYTLLRQVYALVRKNPALERKNSESREQSQTRLNYAKAHPVLRKPKNLCRLNIEYFPVE